MHMIDPALTCKAAQTAAPTPSLCFCSVRGGSSPELEIPTHLEAAWVEADGSEFTHLRYDVHELRAC